MTSIGLISDVHATAAPVAEAMSIFAREGVTHIMCAGDIAGYREELDETIDLLIANDCRSILGNHDLLYLDHHGEESDNPAVAYFRRLPASIDTVIEDRRVYMVHAHPPDACHGGIKLLDRSGELQPARVAEWAQALDSFGIDVLVVGHTHQVFAERLGATLVVNPGSTAFNHACAILRLPELTVETFALSGRAIARSWNWGDHVIRGRE